LSRWVALSDQPDPAGHAETGLLARGLLMAEIEMPLAGAGVLLDMRAEIDGVEVVLSLFHDLGAGIVLLHRQGGRLLRHVLPGPLPQKAGMARLAFGWDAAGPGWFLEMELAGQKMMAQGDVALPVPMAALRALCAGAEGVLRHPAVLWYGVRQGAEMPAPLGWLGMATPVRTARGIIAAGHLQPGERVMTRDNGAVPLIGVTRLQVPGRGSLSPIRLRAPYFGQRGDILVSPDQPVLIAGPEAEYLFGDEEVLVAARHLADGQMAVAESHRAVAMGVVLDLGQPEVIEADGCALATAGPVGVAPARRLLEAFEAKPLCLAMQRMQRRAV
jgi:hypothetical protein